MENYGLYEDIAKRTGGDIYVGVVGPVRCGKSTFITQFMQNLVVPNITDKNIKERTIDELPQSADGKTIMTTQPRFIPSKAASIRVGENVDMNVRMIDCVGYLIDGAIGHEEGDRKRLVKTPWSDEEMPFEEAAELGTKKVIDEHSTIGIVLTTDGSISEIPRSSYIEAEERVVRELSEQGKPFVVVLNTKNPKSDDAKKLSKSLEAKYGVPVLAIDVLKLNQNNIDDIFEKILLEFPIKSLKVKMPQWMQALPYSHPIIQNVIAEIKLDKLIKLMSLSLTVRTLNQLLFHQLKWVKEKFILKSLQNRAFSIEFFLNNAELTCPMISNLSHILNNLLMQKLNMTK